MDIRQRRPAGADADAAKIIDRAMGVRRSVLPPEFEAQLDLGIKLMLGTLTTLLIIFIANIILFLVCELYYEKPELYKHYALMPFRVVWQWCWQLAMVLIGLIAFSRRERLANTGSNVLHSEAVQRLSPRPVPLLGGGTTRCMALATGLFLRHMLIALRCYQGSGLTYTY